MGWGRGRLKACRTAVHRGSSQHSWCWRTAPPRPAGVLRRPGGRLRKVAAGVRVGKGSKIEVPQAQHHSEVEGVPLHVCVAWLCWHLISQV